MAGFSSSIRKLSASWSNSRDIQVQKSKNQTGAGKITKKRHSQVFIEKPKKRSKKVKRNH